MGSTGRKNLALISKCLSNNSLFWHADNFTANKIVESCGSKSEAVKKNSFLCLHMKNVNLKLVSKYQPN